MNGSPFARKWNLGWAHHESYLMTIPDQPVFTLHISDEGQSDSRAIRDAVHNAPLAGYLDLRVQEQEPIYLGSDEDDVAVCTRAVEVHGVQRSVARNKSAMNSFACACLATAVSTAVLAQPKFQ